MGLGLADETEFPAPGRRCRRAWQIGLLAASQDDHCAVWKLQRVVGRQRGFLGSVGADGGQFDRPARSSCRRWEGQPHRLVVGVKEQEERMRWPDDRCSEGIADRMDGNGKASTSDQLTVTAGISPKPAPAVTSHRRNRDGLSTSRTSTPETNKWLRAAKNGKPSVGLEPTSPSLRWKGQAVSERPLTVSDGHEIPANRGNPGCTVVTAKRPSFSI